MAVVALPGANPSEAAAPAITSAPATNAMLPFDMPSPAALRSTGKLAFAHYVPSIPLSVDNRDASVDYYTTQYLNPDGENGKHVAYGGYLRNRPAPRPVVTAADWKLEDMKTEVRQAIAAGLDGFTLTIYSVKSPQQSTNINNMLAAAHAVDPGFKIILMPDMTKGGSLNPLSDDALASYIAGLAKQPSVYRINGKPVLSPFNTESWSLGRWQGFLSTLAGKYGTPVKFMPLFLNEVTARAAYAPITYGMANWGARSPGANNPDTTYSTGPRGRIAAVHELGDKWMQPISVQDERPRASLFQEAGNSENLRDTWQIAIKGGADFVQYATWNDYPEGSPMAPSLNNGGNLLDISSYYLTWWKTGVAPKIVRDEVYVSHRKQPLAAKPSFPQTKLMHAAAGTTPRDTAEALVFLTSPATVTLTAGSKTTTCQAPAGVSSCLVPLSAGTVSAKVVRNATTVASVTSPWKVTNTPRVQDYEYVFAGSARNGTSSSAPTPSKPTPSTPTPTPSKPVPPVAPPPPPTPSGPSGAPTVLTAAVNADTFVDATLPKTWLAEDPQILSRGGKATTVGYFRFEVPKAPAGKTLVSAVLRINTSNNKASGSTSAHTIRPAPADWPASLPTWNNRKSLSSTVLGTLPGGAKPNSTYDIPLDVAGVNGMLGQTSGLSMSTTGNDSLAIWSIQGSQDKAAELVLTFR